MPNWSGLKGKITKQWILGGTIFSHKPICPIWYSLKTDCFFYPPWLSWFHLFIATWGYPSPDKPCEDEWRLSSSTSRNLAGTVSFWRTAGQGEHCEIWVVRPCGQPQPFLQETGRSSEQKSKSHVMDIEPILTRKSSRLSNILDPYRWSPNSKTTQFAPEGVQSLSNLLSCPGKSNAATPLISPFTEDDQTNGYF